MVSVDGPRIRRHPQMLRSFSLLSFGFLTACAAQTPLPDAPGRSFGPEATPNGHAVALGFHGAIETDVPLAELVAHDYTIAARMLPQYPHGYEGPLFASSEGGSWSFGQADYRWGKGGYKKGGPPVLLLLSGREHGVFAPDPELKPNAWRHVAMVRRGPILVAYVDGKRVGDIPASDEIPRGNLRIGARAANQHAGKTVYEGQFYGAVDDVVVYGRALDDAELENAARPGVHPTGAEPGLIAGFTFEPGASAPLLSRPYRLTSAAHEIAVSGDGRSDAAAIPLPALAVPLHLPFDVGQAWRVIQGNCAPSGSHNGYACFAWDLVLAGQPHKNTRGQRAHAAGPGKVLVIETGSGNNWVKITHANEEVSTIMHLLHGSVAVAPEEVVNGGDVVGQVGDTGAGEGNYHLHIAVNLGKFENGSATIPAAFSDYEVSEDEGKTWRHVELGIPTSGQWVKRLR
jgi:hypothetical protein